MSKTKVTYQYRVNYDLGGFSPTYEDPNDAKELAERVGGVVVSRKKTVDYTAWSE